ncbi:choline dehydrogenase [Lineolata rhizophorae]|uniref:Choline dehydrogenase n=1 Tax=Lineolata rhizophorae TaxID=578093 RepID=A0A6A6P4T0_9PEZI|nr:choline dehydrogenase [Lineolata rhizophorae]
MTVLVLEIGPVDDGEDFILIPAIRGGPAAYKYSENFWTVPQTFLDGKSRMIPVGRVLGGGTVFNGLLWNRGDAGDYDDWAALGNPGWGWNEMLPYFKKSETYTPVSSDAIANRFDIDYSPDVHGFDGPVHVGHPKYFYNVSVNFFDGLNALGVPTAFDPNAGTIAGASFLPINVHPTNMTRVDAKRAYYEPFANRDNLYVSTGQRVTKLVFEEATEGDIDGRQDKRDSEGFVLSQNETAAPQTVKARREVIMAAGAIHTPQILQLSGIGDQSLLESLDIPVVNPLPGVGQNFQDHFMVRISSPYGNESYTYPTQLNDPEINDRARRQYFESRTGPWTAGPPDGVAFPSLLDATNRSDSIASAARQQRAGDHLPAGADGSLTAGYRAQKELLAAALQDRSRAAHEILNDNAGGLSVATMRPFARGTVAITSTDPFAAPAIDPRYGANPVDLAVLAEALRFNRALLATDPMLMLLPEQVAPPEELLDDEEGLLRFVRENVQTEFHPSSTCAMMPRHLGGVVDARLRVYGMRNLRVVDASVFPMIPAAHLQAVVYGVAEKVRIRC